MFELLFSLMLTDFAHRALFALPTVRGFRARSQKMRKNAGSPNSRSDSGRRERSARCGQKTRSFTRFRRFLDFEGPQNIQFRRDRKFPRHFCGKFIPLRDRHKKTGCFPTRLNVDRPFAIGRAARSNRFSSAAPEPSPGRKSCQRVKCRGRAYAPRTPCSPSPPR